ncbi:MAG TPA: glycosyltransferase family A protein [Gammaproteobacteria bacterium]
MSTSPIFTVFTPTYNRAATIGRVYSSLEAQTFRDFEWVVVDDGSTDGTGELIEEWRRSASFPIRYFWQQNGHKKTAFNRGVREARGELFLCADSDDAAMPRALETFYDRWMQIPPEQRPLFAGVCGLCVRPEGEIVGDPFPEDVWDGFLPELFYRHRVGGEKWGFVRTDVLRAFPFPEDVPGHVPEGVVWSAIGRKYKTRCVNEPVRVYYDSPDSLTRAREYEALRRNASGLALWAREILSTETSWFRYRPLWFLRAAANYTRFRKHALSAGSKVPPRVSGWLPKMLVAGAYPLGLVLYLQDARRKRRG